MITLADYFGRVSHIADPDETVIANANELLLRVNALLQVVNDSHPGIEAAMKPAVNSGWRPAPTTPWCPARP